METASKEQQNSVVTKSEEDTLLQLVKDLKTRLVSVELLWARLKQMEIRLESLELTHRRLNARISGLSRKAPARYEGSDEQVTRPLGGADAVGVAEEAVKRLHSVQRYSAPQPAQQTTTSQTSPEQSQESSEQF